MPDQSLQTQYDNFLMHHGIKGQKWGVRKRLSSAGSKVKQGIHKSLADDYKRNSANSSYSAKQRLQDYHDFESDGAHGRNAEHYINKRMNDGLTHKKAASEYKKKQAIQAIAGFGGIALSVATGAPTAGLYKSLQDQETRNNAYDDLSDRIYKATTAKRKKR